MTRDAPWNCGNGVKKYGPNPAAAGKVTPPSKRRANACAMPAALLRDISDENWRRRNADPDSPARREPCGAVSVSSRGLSPPAAATLYASRKPLRRTSIVLLL